MGVSRRDFFLGAASLALLPAWARAGAMSAGRMRFVHMTDLHIQPEMGAAEGVRMAVQAVLKLKPRPTFVLTGGDHVMDVLVSGRERADEQFRLLDEALRPLEMPVIPTIGNHDVFGWGDKDVDAKDPLYGKRMFEERTGLPLSRGAYEFGGLKILEVDSIKPTGTGWKAEIGAEGLARLDKELAEPGPKVLFTHVPAVTTLQQTNVATTAAAPPGLVLADGKELFDLTRKHPGVIAVLQGHTHVVEDVDYAGTRWITGGAVSGDWWKGPRLGIHPEGFTVFDWDGKTLEREYVAYGWKARR